MLKDKKSESFGLHLLSGCLTVHVHSQYCWAHTAVCRQCSSAQMGHRTVSCEGWNQYCLNVLTLHAAKLPLPG